jgi:hypothetical protein
MFMSNTLSTLKIDKTAFSVAELTDSDDAHAYWLNRSPAERLQHMQTLRLINYGNTASAGLQRVFEVAQRKAG